MFDVPYFSFNQIKAHLDISYPQAYRAVNHLASEGVVAEVTDRRRNKVFCAHGVLDVLGEAPTLNVRP